MHRMFVTFCIVVLFSILGSCASSWLKINPAPIAPLAGFCLILAGSSCVAMELGDWHVIGSIAGISIVAELTGLCTGIPFGRYEYTGRWWPSIPIGFGHTFPLLLPLSWIMIVGGSYLAIRPYCAGLPLLASISALAVLIDAPMERAMTQVFHYWSWIQPGPIFGAPNANSAGWFLVSALASIPFLSRSRPYPTHYGARVLGVFCLFISASGLLLSVDAAWCVLAYVGTILCLSTSRSQ